MGAGVDLGRVVHHRDQDFLEHRIVEFVEFVVAAPDRLGGGQVAGGVGGEDVGKLPQARPAHAGDAGGGARRRLEADDKGALGDVFGEIADAFEFAGEFADGHHLAQRQLGQRPFEQEIHDFRLDRMVERVDAFVGGDDFLRRVEVAALERGNRVGELALHFGGHARQRRLKIETRLIGGLRRKSGHGGRYESLLRRGGPTCPLFMTNSCRARHLGAIFAPCEALNFSGPSSYGAERKWQAKAAPPASRLSI